jgi:hypothetical protein
VSIAFLRLCCQVLFDLLQAKALDVPKLIVANLTENPAYSTRAMVVVYYRCPGTKDLKDDLSLAELAASVLRLEYLLSLRTSQTILVATHPTRTAKRASTRILSTAAVHLADLHL